MTAPWSADLVIDIALAADLIGEQFNELTPVRIEPFGVGWDNAAFRVNDRFVFRFPRRRVAVPFLESEIRVMPLLAPRLSLPVPAHPYIGQATPRFPWPFVGYTLLPGRTACAAALNDNQRLAIAEPLARFLAGLHSITGMDAIALGAESDKIPRLDLAHQIPRARERLANLKRQGAISQTDSLSAILDTAPADYVPRADTLVHGDLYARHLLVDSNRRLAGVIDWGDVHRGDPAADLMIAHTFLTPAARAVFRRSYGPIPEQAWHIARLRGVWHTLAVLDYAASTSDHDLGRETEAALRNVGECDNV